MTTSEDFSNEIAEINTLHAKVEKATRTTLTDAIRIGKLLFEIKTKVKADGDKWLDWLKEHVTTFDTRTAQRYMKLYKGRNKIGIRHVSYFSCADGLRALKLEDDDEFEEDDEDEDENGKPKKSTKKGASKKKHQPSTEDEDEDDELVVQIRFTNKDGERKVLELREDTSEFPDAEVDRLAHQILRIAKVTVEDAMRQLAEYLSNDQNEAPLAKQSNVLEEDAIV
jgi:Protein of unknown function (DUF3102)